VARIDVGSEDAELVARSFALVEPNARQATALFCRRLAETAPRVRALFRGEPDELCDDVVGTVAAIVHRIDDPDGLADLTVELARRRSEHGIGPEECEAIGDAMLWTLSTGLGHRFDDRHRRAWRHTYGAVASTILTDRVAS
jgi:hemoglobin-like flavoprotein